MKKLICLLIVLMICGCNQSHPLQKEFPNTISINLTNDTGLFRADELVSIQIKELPENFNSKAFVVIDGLAELASQSVDSDGDDSTDGIAFICNLEANQSKDIMLLYATDTTIVREYPKRTQAEISHKVGGKFVKREYIGGEFKNVDFLRVPPEHTDHSWYIRYEGPGWESDKVGYRFYLDWRNAVDIFGKKTTEMVLQNTGLDGFDSYHEMSDWGMDILKVGPSLGIGTIAMWIADSAQRVEKTDSVTSRIVSNGAIQSSVKTDYFGWHINNQSYHLTSMLTINAGSRLTRCDLLLDKNPDNLCTGIVKDNQAHLINSEDDGSEWQYLATYGKQSLNQDDLGMAVLYKKSEVERLTGDKHSNVVILKPNGTKLTYYFLAAWELEPEGITNETDFISYLANTVKKMDNPVIVTIK